MSSDKILQANDLNFEAEVLHSEKPVLVDFWAPWCGPCISLTPILEQAAGELDGVVKVVKFNVDDDTKYTQNYGVRSIPTLILFKDGQVVNKHIGAFSTTKALVEFVNKSLD